MVIVVTMCVYVCVCCVCVVCVHICTDAQQLDSLNICREREREIEREREYNIKS